MTILETVNLRRLVSALIGGSALLILAGGMWAYFALRHIKEPLIIHFNNHLDPPVNQIGSLGDIGLVALFGAIVVVLNGTISFMLEEREQFWGKLVAISTAVLSGLIFIWFAAIISVN